MSNYQNSSRALDYLFEHLDVVWLNWSRRRTWFIFCRMSRGVISSPSSYLIELIVAAADEIIMHLMHNETHSFELDRATYCEKNNHLVKINPLSYSYSLWSEGTDVLLRHEKSFIIPPDSNCQSSQLRENASIWTFFSLLTPTSCRQIVSTVFIFASFAEIKK